MQAEAERKKVRVGFIKGKMGEVEGDLAALSLFLVRGGLGHLGGGEHCGNWESSAIAKQNKGRVCGKKSRSDHTTI